MDTWDSIWDRIISDPTIKEEYRKTFLLNIFQKLCSKMNKDINYREHIKKLFSQSFNKTKTMMSVVEKNFRIELNEEHANGICKWLEAYRKKASSRKSIPLSLKKKLYDNQNGICSVCGQPLGDNYSKIHVDHIIPWVLVGDELSDNYQVLCDTCNECKNARTDYMFKNMIKLT